MESFFDFYQLHKSTTDYVNLYFENPIGKECRFCRRAYPQVSFQNIPHVIPELFGRNSTSSNFECDHCNARFQKYESDVSTMVQHYLTLLEIKTKKGIPIFQSKKKMGERSTMLRSQSNRRNFQFQNNLDDFELDKNKGTLTVDFRTKVFSPFSVYKIFLKVGISLMSDEEILSNKHYLDFLYSEEPITNGMQHWLAYRYMLKTKYYKTPKVNLYKAKNTLINGNEFFEYSIVVCFSNIVFQFFLPASSKNIAEHSSKNHLKVELFPSFILDRLEDIRVIDMYNLDLSETEKVSITDKIVFYFDKEISIE